MLAAASKTRCFGFMALGGLRPGAPGERAAELLLRVPSLAPVRLERADGVPASNGASGMSQAVCDRAGPIPIPGKAAEGLTKAE